MKKTPPKDSQTLSQPLGRGGTPHPAPPNLQSALARRESGDRQEYDKGETLKGPLGR